MTSLLYLSDTYQFTGQATVLSVQIVDDQKIVVLDQTIFYPQGGGQPYDTGEIIGVESFVVTKVRLQPDGTVHHFGQGNLVVGETVQLQVDASRRLENARIHTAGHLVDVAVKNLGIDLKPTKGFHDPAGSYVEYEGGLEISDDLMAELETAVNELVRADLAVIIEDLAPAEAAERGVWAPPGKSARFVYFAGYESIGCGCGGTHVKSTAEIGQITIRKIKSKKGMTRISYAVQPN